MTGDPGAAAVPQAPEASCPLCGAPVGAADSFCESCGTELAPPIVSGTPPGYEAECPVCSVDPEVPPGAIAALAAVPAASSHYAAAQIAAVRILVSGDHVGAATGDELRQAGGQLGRLPVDDARRQQLTVEILRAALDWCSSGQPAGGDPILGCAPNARAVRFGLERSYRALARLTPDEARRVELVDLANTIRPRTLT